MCEQAQRLSARTAQMNADSERCPEAGHEGAGRAQGGRREGAERAQGGCPECADTQSECMPSLQMGGESTHDEWSGAGEGPRTRDTWDT